MIPKGGWKLKEHSKYRLILWFQDGQVRTFYSMDWQHAFAPYDPALGLQRLTRLVERHQQWLTDFQLRAINH